MSGKRDWLLKILEISDVFSVISVIKTQGKCILIYFFSGFLISISCCYNIKNSTSISYHFSLMDFCTRKKYLTFFYLI